LKNALLPYLTSRGSVGDGVKKNQIKIKEKSSRRKNKYKKEKRKNKKLG